MLTETNFIIISTYICIRVFLIAYRFTSIYPCMSETLNLIFMYLVLYRHRSDDDGVIIKLWHHYAELVMDPKVRYWNSKTK